MRVYTQPSVGYLSYCYNKNRDDNNYHLLNITVFYSYYKIWLDVWQDYRNNGANTNATIVISFINIFMEGPAVSLNGSPTVSPTTAAL
jgi:hypothetical protein